VTLSARLQDRKEDPMAWQEESTMELRRQFIQDVQSGATPVSELCAAYQISRKTGYKWLARYEVGGLPSLADQSRRPTHSPTATPPELVTALLAARCRHPRWGPRKLLRLLRQQLPSAPWPARSTLALHLQRAGLSTPPRRVRRPGHPGKPQAAMDAPNAVWTVDFKGQVRLGDGSRCYPLTIADGYSRMLLSCRALTSTQVGESRPGFVHAFQEYGLPGRIRSDNGVPVATQALGRLSPLSVWWVRLGILPDLIEPASPQQNGRHDQLQAPGLRPHKCYASAVWPLGAARPSGAQAHSSLSAACAGLAVSPGLCSVIRCQLVHRSRYQWRIATRRRRPFATL
jgi:putative transposase